VADVKTIVEIIMLLPGKHAARVRRQAAELLCRYLGGDLAIVDEVCAHRGLQEELAVENPDDPRRHFGEMVEASSDDMRKRLLQDVRDVVRNEMLQQHVWSFSKRSRTHRELMDIGSIVHGNALRELDGREHLVRIDDFL